MVNDRRRTALRLGVPRWLGGPPAGSAVACVVFAVLLFPFRLLLHQDDPIAEIVADSAMQSVVIVVVGLIFRDAQRRFDESQQVAGDRVGEGPPAGLPQTQAWARRGAIVGMVVASVFFGGLIALCLLTNRSWLLTAFFGVALVAIVTSAAERLRVSSADGRH